MQGEGGGSGDPIVTSVSFSRLGFTAMTAHLSVSPGSLMICKYKSIENFAHSF